MVSIIIRGLYKFKTDVYIYSNLCEDTIVGDKELPLFRQSCIFEKITKSDIENPYKVPTILGEVHDVHIYI